MVLILWFPIYFFSSFCQTCTDICFTCSVPNYFLLNKNGFQQEWYNNDFFLAFFHFFDSILIVNLLNPSLCKVFPLFWKAYRIRWPTVLNVNNRSCNRCFKINFFFYFETTMFSRDFPSFIFKINHVLIEKKDNSPKKLIYLRRNYIVLM